MKQFLSLIIFVVGSTVIVVGQSSFIYEGQKLTNPQMFNSAAYILSEAAKKTAKKGETRTHPDVLMLLQKCIELFADDFTCNKKFIEEFDRRSRQPGSANEQMDAAKKYRVPAMSVLIKHDPKNHFLYFARALYYSEEGRDDLAIEDITTSIKLSPEMSYADYGVRANMYRRLGKYDLAIADYKKVLSFDSKDAVAVTSLIDIYLERGRGEEALALVNPLIESDTEVKDGWIEERARIYTAMKKFDLASADIDTLARNRNTDDPSVAFNRGLICAAQGDKETAIKFFRLAYEKVPWDKRFKEKLTELGVDVK